MKSLLKAFRNFFLIFAIFVVASMILANSQKARDFVTPGINPANPDFDLPPVREAPVKE